MFRKVLALVALAITSLFLLAGVASADDYVPPSVNPSSAVAVVTDPAVQVLGTSQAAGAPLAYTGSGINVGGAVTIAIIILLVGIALVIAGTKLTKRRSAHH